LTEFAGTVRAPYHVTCQVGIKNNYLSGIPDPRLPIHDTAVTGRLRALVLSLLVFGRKNLPQNGGFFGKKGVCILNFGM